MDRLTPRPLASVLLAAALVVSACSDDDDGGSSASTSTSAPSATTTSAPEADPGDIEIPEVPGTFAAPVPSLGFGIAVPEDWQATVLTPDALERLESAALSRPSFLDAALSVASTGAVFYAAGVGEGEQVSELKIDVQDGAATDEESVRALAQAVVDSGQVDDATVVDDPGSARARVDYRVTLPSAETGDDIEAYGSQLFVPDGDRLWSLIITSEDAETQDALVTIFGSSITFD